jgi:hypothetical protein
MSLTNWSISFPDESEPGKNYNLTAMCVSNHRKKYINYLTICLISDMCHTLTGQEPSTAGERTYYVREVARGNCVALPANPLSL